MNIPVGLMFTGIFLLNLRKGALPWTRNPTENW